LICAQPWVCFEVELKTKGKKTSCVDFLFTYVESLDGCSICTETEILTLHFYLFLQGNTLALALSWVCAIGIVLSSLMNGFGSVSMPHSCLAGLFLEPIRPETVTKAVVDLEKTKESLAARKQMLKEITVTASITPNSTTSSASAGTLWTSKRTVKRSFSGIGEEVRQRKRTILEEISFLEPLIEEMQEDIEDMKYTQKMEAASRTISGRINSWIGVLFSVLLVTRLYFASVAIWQKWYSRHNHHQMDAADGGNGPRKSDIVTTMLLWMLGHNVVSERKYDEVSQFISLLLTAFLSFSQIRAFLRTVGALHRRLHHLCCPSQTRNSNNSRLSPRGDSSSSNDDGAVRFQTRRGVYMHLLAALIGSYFLACIILTKGMVPWQYRSSFSGALGGFDAFVIQSDLINVLFAFSALVSAAVLAMLFGIQKQNAMRHNVSWMDELNTPISRDLDV